MRGIFTDLSSLLSSEVKFPKRIYYALFSSLTLEISAEKVLRESSWISGRMGAERMGRWIDGGVRWVHG